MGGGIFSCLLVLLVSFLRQLFDQSWKERVYDLGLFDH